METTNVMEETVKTVLGENDFGSDVIDNVKEAVKEQDLDSDSLDKGLVAKVALGAVVLCAGALVVTKAIKKHQKKNNVIDIPSDSEAKERKNIFDKIKNKKSNDDSAVKTENEETKNEETENKDK